jgi:dienelactone hydrolase
MLLRRFFHSPHNLIVGDAPFVGILDLPSQESKRPPIRLFFPATLADSASKPPKKATYFVDNRVSYVVEGFAHIALARHTTKLFRFVLRPLIWMLSLVFPVRYLRIPDTALVNNDSSVKYLTPSSLSLNKTKNSKQRLVVFSHGLTGTGEENSIFCTSLAKRGYVVASIHHRDGSSSRVPMPDGSCKFYEHFPMGPDYDPKNRLDQVNIRADEMLDTCDWLLKSDCDEKRNEYPVLKEICDNLDTQNVIATGFSYGAATTALAATKRPNQFQCAILLDGWFHIEWSAKGIDIDFPPDAFSDKTNNGQKGLDVPSLFINSAQFEGYSKLYDATRRLADQISDKSEMHVLPNTRHQNFCDVVFWIQKWALKRCGRFLAIGSADAYESYEKILDWTVRFIDKYFQDH